MRCSTPASNGGVDEARIRHEMTGKVAASILSADFAHLADQVKLVEEHVELIHIDAMDAHFVPPLSVGPVIVESLRRVTRLPLHCHLMVDRPEALLEDFATAGADIVTCHLEAIPDPEAAIRKASDLGMRAGLAVNPDTPVQRLFPFLDALDRVLVMSVRPGWTGQEFLEEALPKIESVRSEIDRRGLHVDVEVDGGINEETAPRCLAAGATVLAAASSIFRAPDPAEAARRLATLGGV
jgi:ribulose-phosphate 3-epimerase